MAKMEEGLSVFTFKRPIDVEAFRNFGGGVEGQAFMARIRGVIGETKTDVIDAGKQTGIHAFVGIPTGGEIHVDLSELTPDGSDCITHRPSEFDDMRYGVRLSGKWITVASNNIDSVA